MAISIPPERSSSTPVLGGRYALGKVIGAGSSATVYEADDLHFDRPVVVKLFSPAIASYTGLRARFSRQVAKAARLRHPNIATVLDAGFSSDDPDVAQPY